MLKPSHNRPIRLTPRIKSGLADFNFVLGSLALSLLLTATDASSVQTLRLAEIDHLGPFAKAAGSQDKIDEPDEKPDTSHSFGKRV